MKVQFEAYQGSGKAGWEKGLRKDGLTCWLWNVEYRDKGELYSTVVERPFNEDSTTVRNWFERHHRVTVTDITHCGVSPQLEFPE